MQLQRLPQPLLQPLLQEVLQLRCDGERQEVLQLRRLRLK